MAVPKKRTSKAKSKSRKANWKRQSHLKCKQALSLGKSLLTEKSNSFIYLGDPYNE
uniref:ribosomal protein L32 n=1 Tax=Caulacanthus ustulatus TaxID=31411 RepID=UPI0027D9D94E|nr:ribosomal protein L32 [Caulacanthus ustulatus]WCH57238.1 ribosomal protein L32 [Caulacanthus ustulatus]